MEDKDYGREMGIKKIEETVREMAKRQQGDEAGKTPKRIKLEPGGQVEAVKYLPLTITFPYSRHSSYHEQCDLLRKLRPRDVWPCTFNPDRWFDRGEPIITIDDLFGRYCSGDTFRHDVEAAEKYGTRATAEGEDVEIIDSQVTTEPDHGSYLDPVSLSEIQDEAETDDGLLNGRNEPPVAAEDRRRSAPAGFDYPYFYHSSAFSYHPVPDDTEDSQVTQMSEFSGERRLASHQAAVVNAVGGGRWAHIALTSTTDNHTMPDVDLGSG